MHDRTWHSAKTASVDAPSHTWDIFNVEQFRRVVLLFEKKLEQINRVHPFNAVAGCGNSGVPLAAALSYTLGIPLITVRKPGERTVANMAARVTGAYNAGPYIIIDDFVSSGGTVNRMMDAIDQASSGKSMPVAMAFYNRVAAPGEMGTDTVSWWGRDKRVPVWGVTREERSYISEGTPLPTAAASSPKQCDLFQWAEDKRRRDEEARALQDLRERQARYELERIQASKCVSMFSPFWPNRWERSVYYSCNEELFDAYEEPKPNSKPPKYKPPEWVTGGSRLWTLLNVPLPRNAR